MDLRLGYIGKVALLAALYVCTGKLGLLLAVPPGYATIIWPPSGIALGMLLVHGARLWPGVLLGSLVLNGYVSGVWSPEHGVILSKLFVVLAIAAGSTLQALAARALIGRFIGLPLRLNHAREVFKLFVLGGPIACLVAATVGVGTLYLADIAGSAVVARNWFSWWAGDVFGITVFLPLVLLMQGRTHRFTWRDEVIRGLPLASMLMLIMPLGLTFYAWKIASGNAYRQSQTQFESLASESEKALLYRLSSYGNATLGGAGFFQGSGHVTRAEWRAYVQSIQVEKNFPGINGIGWIKRLTPDQVDDYVREIRADDAATFEIHPVATGAERYVIVYIEPYRKNRQAIGLDIAFEANRREAADISRDTGRAAITRRVVLVQDEKKTPGFLLLQPLYRKDAPVATVEQRRAALDGWVYAPFIAENFLASLTRSQGEQLNLRIYDGGAASEDALIFDSGAGASAIKPTYTVRKQIEVMQQRWLLVWESTPTFEQAGRTEGPLFILMGGLLFTGMFGLFLLLVSVRRTETMEWLGGERQLVLPVLVLVLLGAGSYVLYSTLREKESGYIHGRVDDEARKIDLLLTAEIDEKLRALQRMASRWEVGGRPQPALWRADARYYTQHLSGLRAVEWIDPQHRVRWVEPLQGNEQAIGLDVRFNAQRARALEGAAERDMPTLTAPLELVQGYPAFIAYLPLRIEGKFDGFIAGLFSVQDFFGGTAIRELGDAYAISIGYDGREQFTNGIDAALQDQRWTSARTLQLYDKRWSLRIAPTLRFVESQKTSLPVTVLMAGLLIAVLAALAVRYLLVSRLKTGYLEASTKALRTSAEHLRLLVENSPAAVAMFDRDLRYLLTSRRWIHDYHLGGQRIVGRSHYEVFPEILQMPVWLDIHKRALKGEVFSSQEDSWMRADGRREWIQWAIHPWRDNDGAVGGIIMFTEVISARKEAELALKASEETFRTAMGNAPIGTALVALNGRFMKVNPALCKLLGHDERELLLNDFQSITHPDDLQRDQSLLLQVLGGELNTYQMEKRYYHKDGHAIWALLSVSLVHRQDGEPDYFIAQIQDISERKHMERMKNEFISIVSHELRTPLTSIRGSLGLVLGALGHDLSEKVRRMVEIALNNSERLVLLINDILDIDKIASGHMRFDIREESVATLTLHAVQANEAYARKFGVRIVLEAIDERIAVRVDASRYQQVLSNLLSNAAKFSPPDTVVEVRANVVGERVRICVQDHGNGIPPEFRARIFGRFSQADSSSSRQKGGTGLGLHITQQLVERMSGGIGFESQVGEGATFWVEFPMTLLAGSRGASPIRTEVPSTREETAALSGEPRPVESRSDESLFIEPPLIEPVVLHIEDDIDLCAMLAAALQGEAELVKALTLGEAETLLRQRRFSMILLDIAMPDGSGLDLLKRLGTLVRKQPPVVVLAAEVPPQWVYDAVEAVMVKTLMPEATIISTIRSVLRRSSKTAMVVATAETPTRAPTRAPNDV